MIARIANDARIATQRSQELQREKLFYLSRKDLKYRKDRIGFLKQFPLKRKDQGSQVTIFRDPCVTCNPCNHMETRLKPSSSIQHLVKTKCREDLKSLRKSIVYEKTCLSSSFQFRSLLYFICFHYHITQNVLE